MKWYENVVNVCMGIQPGEKVMGTIYIAIGHNAAPPYNGPNHARSTRSVMRQPTLTIDGAALIDNGKYLV